MGATRGTGPIWIRSNCFNPRPPRKVGATCRLYRHVVNIQHVSILAHPERWALRDEVLVRISVLTFQSSPTPKGGRYRPGISRPKRNHQVSILAHPERWALPHGKPYHPGASMFQSSPTPKGGRYRDCTSSGSSWKKFQSSPTPKGGRYCIAKICQTFRQLIYPSGEPPFRIS